MKKLILPLLAFIILTPMIASAQSGGTLVGSLGLGLNTANGDFSDPEGLSAGTGIGLEAELRYYLWGGFSFGGFANYSRFSSGHQLSEGRVSYNFSQVGGLVKMNFIRLKHGRIYLSGGGGIFKPSVNFYVPENTYSRVGEETGNFFFGGIGLMSKTDRRMLYELEIRYNLATADMNVDEIRVGELYEKWNFIYFGVKLSFASKGKSAPPRY